MFFPIKEDNEERYPPILKCKAKEPVENKGIYDVHIVPYVWKNKGQCGITVKVVEYSKV